jgi:DNA-binding PadR family transcriptional regulator
MSAVVRQRVEGPLGPEAVPPLDPTEDFSCTCVLLLLDERPGTGAELCRRLRQLGLVDDDADPGRVEAILEALERALLVSSADDPGAEGAPRIYRLTVAGAERLGIEADDLRSTQILLDRFLARCGERLVS